MCIPFKYLFHLWAWSILTKCSAVQNRPNKVGPFKGKYKKRTAGYKHWIKLEIYWRDETFWTYIPMETNIIFLQSNLIVGVFIWFEASSFWDCFVQIKLNIINFKIPRRINYQHVNFYETAFHRVLNPNMHYNQHISI